MVQSFLEQLRINVGKEQFCATIFGNIASNPSHNVIHFLKYHKPTESWLAKGDLILVILASDK